MISRIIITTDSLWDVWSESNKFVLFFWDDIPVSCNLFIVATRKMTLCCCNTWCFCKRFAPLFFFFFSSIHFILLTFEKYSEMWMHCKNCLLLWRKKKQNALRAFLYISATVVQFIFLFWSIAYTVYTTHMFTNLCNTIWLRM